MVWFHGASLGELEHGRGIWENLESFGVTFTSPSAEKKTDARARFWRRLWGGLVPVGIPSPEVFVSLCNEIQPVVLATLGSTPWVVADYHTYGTPSPLKVLLRRAEKIFVQFPEDQERLKGYPVVVNGNCRIDRVLSRKKTVEDLRTNFLWKSWVEKYQGKILILGSVYEEDFRIIWEDVKKLIDEHGYGVIIAPHESRTNIPFEKIQRLSEVTILDPEIGIVHADIFGKLFEIYGIGDVAYVGAKKRIHSVLEPAAFGLKLFGAPRMNGIPVAQAMVRSEVLKPIKNSGELFREVSEQSQKDPLSWMEQHRGASTRICEFLVQQGIKTRGGI